MVMFLQLQEARERDPVPDRERFRIRHSCRDCSFHPGEKRPQQADDWRVSGKPTETIQQRCFRVSTQKRDWIFVLDQKVQDKHV